MSVSCKALVKNKRGIHARPSSEIAKTALTFNSEIIIKTQGNKANAKDVLQIIMLELFEGSEVTIEVTGSDEKKALNKIKRLIEKEYKFD
jgi:phosphotransferase system HPr (HPr) family protein